jgi:hypothetical protein
MGLALIASLLLADLTPEQLAKVQHERDKALEEVKLKYGGKPSSELTQDERRDMIKDQREAESQVLEKNGVDAKEIARYEAKLSLDDRAATKAAKQQIEEKEKQQAAEKEKKAEPGEIPIQRGFNDANPVTLEEKTSNGAPVVEKGLPPEAQDDIAAAGGKSNNDEPLPEPAAPAKPAKGGKAKHK